ncbi:MAG: GNAT family N-acetyltransferase [Candidatus Hydrogenedentes bacterium]|nr:GNAT family N-acetyltransferase [Candidatus Hydrogenedentota bacterium]
MSDRIRFRPGVAEDVEPAVPLIYSSGPAAFDFVFSHRTPIDAQTFLRRTFLTGAGEFGYAGHVVGEMNGVCVATAAGWSADALRGFMLVALRQILRHYGVVAGIGVMSRGLRMEHMLSTPTREEFYIAHVGVTPGLRGHGIGGQLMEAMLARARAQGMRYATLDVSIENPRAEALYARLGFEVISETPSSLANATARVPGHRKMLKRLG